MKDGVKYLVGKQIAAVIVARSKRPWSVARAAIAKARGG